MTDADVDGSHIRTLLLIFFFRYMASLIDEGHLYISQPPFYRLANKNQVHYAYNDAEKDMLLKSLGVRPDKISLSRYKDLGEMNPQQLWEMTMNPVNRTLLLVTVDDAAEADRTFDMLIGDDVAPRKRFIQTQTKAVRNLDILKIKAPFSQRKLGFFEGWFSAAWASVIWPSSTPKKSG